MRALADFLLSDAAAERAPQAAGLERRRTGDERG
jgi:hypothetical protein